MLDLLRERGGGHIKVFGGGGGVIVPAEIDELHDYGVTRIFSPEDGQKLGLQGHDQRDRRRVRCRPRHRSPDVARRAARRRSASRARMRSRALITGLEKRRGGRRSCAASCWPPRTSPAMPALGITGTGGAPARARSPTNWCAGSGSTSSDALRDRDHLDRSVAAQIRRRAARRPHPDERDRASQHLHALARHARRRQRDFRSTARRDGARARSPASTS